MATTTDYSIVYPVGTTVITALNSHFANLANSTDTAIGTSAMRMSGTDAQRTALTAPKRKAGLIWYSTDTKREWEYDGSNWVTQDVGMLKVWPTSVTNGTIATDGTVIPTTGATSLSFNGAFSSLYKKYVLHYSINMSTSTTASIRMRAAGSDLAAANYVFTIQSAQNSANTVATAINFTAHQINNVNNAYLTGSIEFSNPTATNSPKFTVSDNVGAPAAVVTNSSGYIGNQDSTVYDGFSLRLDAGGFASGYSHFFKLYAFA